MSPAFTQLSTNTKVFHLQFCIQTTEPLNPQSWLLARFGDKSCCFFLLDLQSLDTHISHASIHVQKKLYKLLI